MRPIQDLKFNLNQNFWEDSDDEGRVQKPESTVLDYTPIEAESLLKDYSTSGSKGIHQKNITLDGREGTLSVSRTHNSLLKKGGEVPKITFYPRSEAWVNQMNQDWAKAEFAANLPLHLAPFIGMAKGGRQIVKQKQLNKYKTIFENVDTSLRSKDAFNVTPGALTKIPKNLTGFNPKGLIQEQMFKLTKEQQVKFVSNMWRYDTSPTTTTSKIGNLKNALVNQKESDIASRIYPGGNKVQQQRREKILTDNPTARAYMELLTKHDKLTENSELITIGKKQVKVNPLSKEEFEADVNRLIELKEALNLPSPKQFSQELGTIVIDGNSYRWGSKGGLVPEKVIPEGEMSSAQKRAFQLDPANHPGPVNWWKQAQAGYKPETQTTREIGIHPDIKFEDFRNFSIKTSAIAHKLTSRLAKLWNLNKPTEGVLGSFPEGMKIDGKGAHLPRADAVDTGHMASAESRASDLGMSKLVETNLGNRRTGKLNAFEKRVFEVLDIPGSGGSGKLASGRKPTKPEVIQKLAEREQGAWMKAITDYVANRKVDPLTGKIVITDHRDAILTQADKLRLQYKLGTTPTVNRKGIWSIPISGQEQAAMQVMAERRIAEAYFEAGLGESPDEMAILKQALKEASAEEQVLKAQYISKKGQEFRAQQKNPLARQDEIEANTKELTGVTVSRGKTDEKRMTGRITNETVIQLPSEATGRPKFRSEDEALEYYLKELKDHFDKTGSITTPSKR